MTWTLQTTVKDTAVLSVAFNVKETALGTFHLHWQWLNAAQGRWTPPQTMKTTVDRVLISIKMVSSHCGKKIEHN